MMANDDLGVEDLPDDLTPFITRTTMDHVSGGAFGDVWKCNYNADGISALVAVKAFRFSEGDVLETINRKISREIGILKILRHNNIVPLWGIATGFGRMLELPCLVSPWMPNGTLNAYLQSKHSDLTVLDRSRMLEDVSAGLRYLHSVPVMHGDITGANILIDRRGHARLIDFGLSTIVQPLLGQSHLEISSVRPGAIRYAAPEFVLSDDALELPLEKADIYSFGCIMLQVLSGRLPWSEIGSGRLITCIIVTMSQGRGPQRPDGHPAIIDPDWDFIQRCLQFGPELRPSADEVLDFVMHRFSSSGSTRPPDDPPDDPQDGFPGDSSYGGSGGSDATEKPPDIPPPHFGHVLDILTTDMHKLSTLDSSRPRDDPPGDAQEGVEDQGSLSGSEDDADLSVNPDPNIPQRSAPSLALGTLRQPRQLPSLNYFRKVHAVIDDDANTSLTFQTLNADGTPKRPMNAFMIFARRRRPQVSAENQSMRTGDVSKILSREWNAMDLSEKQFYLDEAKQLKDNFNLKYPDYVYRRRPNNSANLIGMAAGSTSAMDPAGGQSPKPEYDKVSPVDYHHDSIPIPPKLSSDLPANTRKFFKGDSRIEVISVLANCGTDIAKAGQALTRYIVRKQEKGRSTEHILTKLRQLELKFMNDTTLHAAFRDARANTCLLRSPDLPSPGPSNPRSWIQSSSSPVESVDSYLVEKHRTQPEQASLTRHSQPPIGYLGKLRVFDPSIKPYACGHESCWPATAASSLACYTTSRGLSDHNESAHLEDAGGEHYKCGLEGCGKSWKSIHALEYHLQISTAHYNTSPESYESSRSETPYDISYLPPAPASGGEPADSDIPYGGGDR